MQAATGFGSATTINYDREMFAYIRYVEDNVKAVLPVSLIKNYRPKTVSDRDKTPRLAYWRSADGATENYFPAEVLLLSGKSPKNRMNRNWQNYKHRILEKENVEYKIEGPHACGKIVSKMSFVFHRAWLSFDCNSIFFKLIVGINLLMESKIAL